LASPSPLSDPCDGLNGSIDDEELAARKLEYEYFGSLLEFLEEEYTPWCVGADSIFGSFF
jgi:hypothetical protein